MSTKNINQVICDEETLIDLSADTVIDDQVLSGITVHNKGDTPITGEYTFDIGSSGATVAAEIPEGKTAYTRGAVLDGTISNNDVVAEVITVSEQAVLIDERYNVLSQVMLPYVESGNGTDGITVANAR